MQAPNELLLYNLMSGKAVQLSGHNCQVIPFFVHRQVSLPLPDMFNGFLFWILDPISLEFPVRREKRVLEET